MVTKKTPKTKETDKKEEAKKDSRYFYAVGRRKTSVAKVKLFVDENSKENQNFISVNGQKPEDYFPVARLVETVKAPLEMAGEAGKFTAEVKVSGGGTTAQADAALLGIARALVVFNEELKPILKSKSYLTRDPRKVERKKPGLKKARRAPQWAKR